ncbi:MAG: hypothetical protein JW821_16285 [Deltaproteobacteria bacterium]|nr:hypothetical protein [Deltaproteobacteria bacterium]
MILPHGTNPYRWITGEEYMVLFYRCKEQRDGVNRISLTGNTGKAILTEKFRGLDPFFLFLHTKPIPFAAVVYRSLHRGDRIGVAKEKSRKGQRKQKRHFRTFQGRVWTT